ncbi:hypothetical protein KSF78_0004343 [Schistosoma japonicum]|nr:hypothetical protein KSF78_0004343 [Schistosoma japonicum]
MGANTSNTLDQSEVEEIAEETGFSPKQIYRLYNRYLALDKTNAGYLRQVSIVFGCNVFVVLITLIKVCVFSFSKFDLCQISYLGRALQLYILDKVSLGSGVFYETEQQLIRYSYRLFCGFVTFRAKLYCIKTRSFA